MCAQCYIFSLNLACPSLDILLPTPSMDFQPLNVCSKLQYLENPLSCWHDLYPVIINKTIDLSVQYFSRFSDAILLAGGDGQTQEKLCE